MKIIITGSSGFIGKKLISLLSSKKYKIEEYDLVSGKDILDYDKLEKAMSKCDVVIHLASLSGIKEKFPFSDYFKVNCEGTLNVAEAAVKQNVKRIIYASSTAYYGLGRRETVKPIKESNYVLTQYDNINEIKCLERDVFYSTSKVIAEQILANYGITKKIEVLILRFAPIGDNHKSWSVEGVNLSVNNALQAIEKTILVKDKIWHESFTIADKGDNVDVSKAENILNYFPK